MRAIVIALMLLTGACKERREWKTTGLPDAGVTACSEADRHGLSDCIGGGTLYRCIDDYHTRTTACVRLTAMPPEPP